MGLAVEEETTPVAASQGEAKEGADTAAESGGGKTKKKMRNRKKNRKKGKGSN